MAEGIAELYLMLLEPDGLRVLWMSPNGHLALQARLGRSPVGVPLEECARMHGTTGLLQMAREVAETGSEGHLWFSNFTPSGERWSTDLVAHRLPSGDVLVVEQFVPPSSAGA
jgi:hypothetical protein